jgi:hypothetical protein
MARVRPGTPIDGRIGPMRERLATWTILTCVLLAVAVWSLLGPPPPASGLHLHFRNLAAAATR